MWVTIAQQGPQLKNFVVQSTVECSYVVGIWHYGRNRQQNYLLMALFVWGRVLLCSLPHTKLVRISLDRQRGFQLSDPFASICWVLGFEVYTTTLGYQWPFRALWLISKASERLKRSGYVVRPAFGLYYFNGCVWLWASCFSLWCSKYSTINQGSNNGPFSFSLWEGFSKIIQSTKNGSGFRKCSISVILFTHGQRERFPISHLVLEVWERYTNSLWEVKVGAV